MSSTLLPELSTDRLIMSPLDAGLDGDELFSVLDQPGTLQYVAQGIAFGGNREAGVKFIKDLAAPGTAWAIRLRADERVIGFCSLEAIGGGWAEVGVVIGPAWHRHGYGREVLRGIVELVLSQPRYQGVLAGVKPANAAMRGLAESLGFEEIGRVPNRPDEIAYRLFPVSYYEATGWEPPHRKTV